MKKSPIDYLKANLNAAGFPRKAVESLLVPGWWREACADDEGALQYLGLKVASFFRIPYALAARLLGERVQGFTLPEVPQMSLKATAKSAPALPATLWKIYNLSEVLQRGFSSALESCSLSREDGEEVRDTAMRIRAGVLGSGCSYVDFQALCQYCWQNNIILAHASCVAGGFLHGAALGAAEERENPVIVLCSKDREAMQAFRLAHELGHIVLGHPGNSIDSRDEGVSRYESEADEFARALLLGDNALPDIQMSYKRMAANKKALQDAGRRIQVPQEVLALFLARAAGGDAYAVFGKMYPNSQDNPPQKFINGLLFAHAAKAEFSSSDMDDLEKLTA